MSTIAGIVRAGKGRAGSYNAWRCESAEFDGVTIYRLTHYGHFMLAWNKDGHGRVAILDYDTGYGTVSDQHGVNKALRALGIYDLYYSRKGGSHYV